MNVTTILPLPLKPFAAGLLLTVSLAVWGQPVSLNAAKPSADRASPGQAPRIADVPGLRDGPFGLKMGLSGAEMGGIQGRSKVLFRLPAVPVPHPNFVAYTVLAPPKTGLCSITAWYPPIRSNEAGVPLRSVFANLKAAIERKYGPVSVMIDQNDPNGPLHGPAELYTFRDKKEMPLKAYWMGATKNPNSRAIDLPHQLAAITIEAATTGSGDNVAAQVTLVYEFKNMPACVAEMKLLRDLAPRVKK